MLEEMLKNIVCFNIQRNAKVDTQFKKKKK